MKLVAYTRGSTEDQDLTHDAQLATIRARHPEAELVHVEDTCSGSVPLADREGGAYALQLVKSGRADGIVVAKLDRAFRSTRDGLSTAQCAVDEGWSLLVLNLGLDTSTPMGRAMFTVALAFAELDRELISERTKDGLAAKRVREPDWHPGGHAHPHPANVLKRIRHERHDLKMSLREIATGLNADGVRTARDGRWHASTVRDVLRRTPPTTPPVDVDPEVIADAARDLTDTDD